MLIHEVRPSTDGYRNGSDSRQINVAHAGWQRELAQAIRSGEELLRRLNLNPDDQQTQQMLQTAGIQLADQDTLRRFPVLVPENFLARMTPGDPARSAAASGSASVRMRALPLTDSCPTRWAIWMPEERLVCCRSMPDEFC